MTGAATVTGSIPSVPDPVLLLYCADWGCQPGRVRPRIRYCATPAGRVAYSTSGAGPALLCDSGWITDLRAQLELRSFGSFMERLAERFTVIRYDKPGCGLSDRDGVDLSFDGQVAAALAVADAAGADRFGLFGASQGGQLAAAIAARHPDRVEALARWNWANPARSSAVGSVTKAPASAFSPRPQCARTSATTDFRTSAGARSRPLAHIPYTASASTRPGCFAAIAAAS